MDGSHSEGLDSKITEELKPDTQASKRRKVVQKTVVTVKIEANEGKQRSEGPPSDCWSWRKYGQKPIKGSPYPRGYYRCSTSKGCSAKKQVERSRTDASMLIITYTSSHNHPGPVLPTTNNLTVTTTEHSKLEPPTEDQPTTTTPQKEDLEQEAQDQDQQPLINSDEDANEDHFHYSQSPFNNSQENPFAENLENTTTYEAPSVVLFEEEPLSCYNPPLPPPLMAFSAIDKSEEEYDFYDELEELPSSSSSSSSSSFFTSFLRNNFFDERILVHPS
ncbi:hypothetical protein ACSBR2_031664 [Camellia fascicularis]